MSAYVEQVFNDVEKMRGKVLADRFRMVFKKIQLVKNDDSDEAYNLKQQENLAAVTELQNAGGFIDWDIKVTKYSNNIHSG
jgi:CHASE3 domain sensor protein